MANTENTKLGRNSLVTSGRLVRTARIYDEFWTEDFNLAGDQIRTAFHENRGNVDLFSFVRPLPESKPFEGFHIEWENVAVAKTENFSEWWEALPQESRKNVRRSQKRGVEVRAVEFDDSLVAGISAIYNESPLRQGRKFWHYGKTVDQVKKENATYLDRSTFVGAFLGSELVGFVKFVKVGKVGRVMQILSRDAHADKRPTNALLAKSVELCGPLGMTHFIYGQYVYGTKENSPMTEFKRRNGFERLDYPRHFLPLSTRGHLALKFGLHRELRSLIPESIVNLFLTARTRLLQRQFAKHIGVTTVCAQDS